MENSLARKTEMLLTISKMSYLLPTAPTLLPGTVYVLDLLLLRENSGELKRRKRRKKLLLLPNQPKKRRKPRLPLLQQVVMMPGISSKNVTFVLERL